MFRNRCFVVASLFVLAACPADDPPDDSGGGGGGGGQRDAGVVADTGGGSGDGGVNQDAGAGQDAGVVPTGCESNDDCDEGELCRRDVDGEMMCVAVFSGCTSDADCLPPAYCEAEVQACVESCGQGGTCPDPLVCAEMYEICAMPCGPGDTCPVGTECQETEDAGVVQSVCLPGRDSRACGPEGQCPEGQRCNPMTELCEQSGGRGDECMVNADCEEGQRCRDGVCEDLTPCQGDDQCANGETCLETGFCGVEGACATDDDCPITLRCVSQGEGVAGQCQSVACQADLDCRPGTRCNAGECVVDARQDCERDADCPDGQRCNRDNGQGLPDPEQRADVCVTVRDLGAGECRSDFDCEGDAFCDYDDPVNPNRGHCRDPGGGDFRCDEGEACPEGFTCDEHSGECFEGGQGGGGGGGGGAMGMASCTSDDDCPEGVRCSRLNMMGQNMQACMNTCGPGQGCPNGQRCQNIMGMMQVCACNGNEQCADGQICMAGQMGMNTCVERCLDGGRCRNDALSCQDVDGERVCAPADAGGGGGGGGPP